jgi:thymidylate synthase
MMKIFIMPLYPDITTAYLAVLEDVYLNPDFHHEALTPDNVSSTNPVTFNENWYFNKGAYQEKINYSFAIETPSESERIETSDVARNLQIYDYSVKETELFDSGDREGLKEISKVWARIANPDGTVNANYGYMVYHLRDTPESLSQWEWALNRLRLNLSTNQAYLHFNRPKDQWNENLDQPCCLAIQFLIRDKKLNLIAYMRSNDLVYGTPYNILYFVKLMHRMLRELNDPELKIGNYYHHATSIHIYKKHLGKVRKMLSK